jgi:hypothetical protein
MENKNRSLWSGEMEEGCDCSWDSGSPCKQCSNKFKDAGIVP